MACSLVVETMSTKQSWLLSLALSLPEDFSFGGFCWRIASLDFLARAACLNAFQPMLIQMTWLGSLVVGLS